MDFTGQYKTLNLAPPKGQGGGSNPLRDANEINILSKNTEFRLSSQGANQMNDDIKL